MRSSRRFFSVLVDGFKGWGFFYLNGLLNMQDFTANDKIFFELSQGMDMDKCRKCGCMKMTLEGLQPSIKLLPNQGMKDLFNNINLWLRKIEPIEYDCLGCDFCYPAEAKKIFNQSFSGVL